MRRSMFYATVNLMNRFTRQYLVLTVLLLAGVVGSLVTPLGGDPRIGTFSAGITIGVLVAFYMLRIAELRSLESIKSAHLDFHPNEGELAAGTAVAASEPLDEPALDESEPEERELDPVSAGSNIVQFDSPTISEQKELELHADDEEENDLCSCACDCQWRSRGGGFDLCGNCQRWWFQQSTRCVCGYDTTGTCSCGAVIHRPTHLEEEFLRAA